jgi:hypothetical protein
MNFFPVFTVAFFRTANLQRLLRTFRTHNPVAFRCVLPADIALVNVGDLPNNLSAPSGFG